MSTAGGSQARDQETVSVVVRHHDPEAGSILQDALFSIAAQTHPSIELVMVVQNFSEEAVQSTLDLARSVWESFSRGFRCQLLNVKVPEGVDGRSRLLNAGVDAASGEWLAFLDFDDIVYPNAYSLLAKGLLHGHASMTVGSVRRTRVNRSLGTPFRVGRLPDFVGSGFRDLVGANFIPIHSFMCRAAHAKTLRFREDVWLEEDYLWLLEFAATFPIDFSRLGTYVAEYRYDVQGTTTTPVIAHADEFRDHYTQSIMEQHRVRSSTHLSEAVKSSLGLSRDLQLTLADLNVVWALQSVGPARDALPAIVAHHDRSTPARIACFGDTYLQKHLDCAIPLLPALAERGVVSVLTATKVLPASVDPKCLIYFNRPSTPPPAEFEHVPRVLVDHGASHLKWFLGSRERLEFFDKVIVAGPDHLRSLESIFTGESILDRVRSVGFVKSQDLLGSPRWSREEACRKANLSADEPIVLFAPTWHLSANPDVILAMNQIARMGNHVAVFHPETQHLPINGLNVVDNVDGITTELIKHADLVVSDVSSTLYEAAALGKRIVQLLLREYPDNTSMMFDFPFTAGTSELFSTGVLCRPDELAAKVSELLVSPALHEEALGACRERILWGTRIDRTATESIAEAVAVEARVSTKRTRTKRVTQEGAVIQVPPSYQANLFFARRRLIAHGAGDYRGFHASNSLEAAKAAARVAGLVELDFCLGSDGVLVAHDGFEDKYGFASSFLEISESAFLSSRFGGALTTMSVEDAVVVVAGSGAGLVCDVKPSGPSYAAVAERIWDAAQRAGVQSRIVMQCYRMEDVETANRLGFSRVLLAVWKYYYRDPLGPEAMDFIVQSVGRYRDMVWAVSLPYFNKHMSGPVTGLPQYKTLQATWKRIFVHGAPVAEYDALLRDRAGIFADRVDRHDEFRDVPQGFEWREYLFLNPDLVEAGLVTEVAAMSHFLRWGLNEGRLARFDRPDGFNYLRYLDANPDLRASGIAGEFSALAHWTRHGRDAGLKTGIPVAVHGAPP